MTRVAINGFGRVGRLALRAGWDRDDLEFVHVNEPNGGPAAAAHLLTFDSVHGRWDRGAHADAGDLVIDDIPLRFTEASEPAETSWEDSGIDVVLECSGRFRTMEKLQPYFDHGVRKVIVDPPHKDLRRARAAGVSLIPTSTGSATAIGLIFPELEGKLDGLAVRVPLLNASLTDAVFEVARPSSVKEVNGLLQTAADAPLAGILGYEERPLVSVDYKDDPRSGIVDALSTRVTDRTQVKVLAWYDNEWGYANRMVELAAILAGSLTPA